MIKTMLESSDFLGFLAAVFTFLGTLYLFKITPKYQMVRERYDHLIYPVFNILEPYLFKPVDNEIFEEALLVIEENLNIAGCHLRDIVFYSRKAKSQENFNALCRCINSEFDISCVRLGLKRRSITYRINHEQYQTKLMFILYIVFYIFLHIFLFLVMLSVVGLIGFLLEKLGFFV